MRRIAVVVITASVAVGISQTDHPANSLTHFRQGEAEFSRHNFQAAANEFREALNGGQEPQWTQVWSHINLGKIFDATGQCERAIREYTHAERTKDDAKGAQKEVSDYLYLMQIRPFSTQPQMADDTDLPRGSYREKDVDPPKLIDKIEAAYTDEARLAGLEGSVRLVAVIGEDGSPREVRTTGELGLGLDEKAMEAVEHWRFTPGTREGRPVPVFVNLAVDFRLPSKQSRWHLLGVTFRTPSATSRPVFADVRYPLGSGVAPGAIEQARLVAAMGRYATATLTFDVDERGAPARVRVESVSEETWRNEAMTLVRSWRFKPGLRGGIPVAVPCTVTLAWGARDLRQDSAVLSNAAGNREAAYPNSCRTTSPKVISSPAAAYSEAALTAKLEGTVLVTLVVGEDGKPKTCVLRGRSEWAWMKKLSRQWVNGGSSPDNRTDTWPQCHSSLRFTPSFHSQPTEGVGNHSFRNGGPVCRCAEAFYRRRGHFDAR